MTPLDSIEPKNTFTVFPIKMNSKLGVIVCSLKSLSLLAGPLADLDVGHGDDDDEDDEKKGDSAEGMLHEYVYRLKNFYLESERNLKVSWF